jgi:hypothetical protein
MRRQSTHATENGFPVVLGERHIVDRGRDLERRRADSTEVRIGVENSRQQSGLEHLFEPFLARPGGAETR